MARSIAEATEEIVRIRSGQVRLEGGLAIPEEARGLVLFAHGSGSSRHSPRNRFVAERLRAAGLGTLLIDLLTKEEEALDQTTGHLRFDIGLLARRLTDAIDWLENDPRTADLAVGCFGASTGAAAALVAAAARPERVAAVVSRGGRPDLAGDSLPRVRAPTLLIVGGNDQPVLHLNDEALEVLGAPVKRIFIVPGASHLFEEPGTLESVASLAADWFQRYLDRAHEEPAA